MDEIQLIKGGKYNINILQKKDFELVGESMLFYFYRKKKILYVFDKKETNLKDEYILVAMWED